VVAHSTGAILAAALGIDRPDLTGQILIGLPSYPDEATARTEIGHLSLMARLTATANPLARAMCRTMCRVRPLAVALAPLVARDLPARIARDGARHTWHSYHGTLERVVVQHRVAAELAAAQIDTLLLHGADDRTAPCAGVEQLEALARKAGAPVHLRIVEGDHHLAVRRAEVAGAAIVERLRR